MVGNARYPKVIGRRTGSEDKSVVADWCTVPKFDDPLSEVNPYNRA